MNTCPHCLEEIKKDAKKCPHCCEWIRTNAQWKRGLITLLPLIVLFGGYLYIGNSIQDTALSRIDEFSSVQGLEIVSHKKIRQSGSSFILGKIKNKGPKVNKSVKVEASLYNSKNEFIDLDWTLISGVFEAGEIRPFKLLIGCKKRPGPKDFDHYTLKLR